MKFESLDASMARIIAKDDFAIREQNAEGNQSRSCEAGKKRFNRLKKQEKREAIRE